jgi:cytoskeletal protein RodZ
MVKNIFIKKSIGTLTLGEKLRKLRSERRVSLAEASKATKVQVKYLEYLENEEYGKLPADVYVKGFLRNYALYLGINEEATIKKYERERDVHKNISKEEKKSTFIQPIKFSNFVITPKVIFASGVALAIIVGFLYLYRQANNFVSNPRLIINEPLDNAEVKERSIRVSGIAERDAELVINNQGISTDDEGRFGETVTLRKGVNSIVVKVKNRFDKETVKIISVKADFDEPNQNENNLSVIPESETGDQKTIKLEVSVDPGPTWVAVEVDGSLVFSGTLDPGKPKEFEGGEKILISSGKGNNTYVTISGKEKRLLSPDPGAVNDIIFEAEQ